jgi:regulator of RNase E activity RraA
LTLRPTWPPDAGNTSWPDIVVRPGDILVCDIDGCVAIPAGIADKVAEMAARGQEVDQRIAQALREGMGVADAVKKYRS